MKNKKLLFNHLVLQYHKSIGRLKRLSERGLNLRRQTILSKRIEKIKQQLLSIKHALTKASAVAGFVSGIAVLQPNNIKAQNFLPPVINPFSLNITSDSISNIKSIDFADLDADGDFDAIIYNRISGRFYYLQNIGTLEFPEYGAPNELLISIPEIEYYGYFYSQYLDNICLGDLDFDGDFDLMGGATKGNFIYFENTGTDVIAEFANVEINPFQLINKIEMELWQFGYNWYNYISSLQLNTIEFVDLDGDGDLDIYTLSKFEYCDWDGGYAPGICYEYYVNYYIQNMGNPSSPQFSPHSESSHFVSGEGDLADFDSDGDFDYVTMVLEFSYNSFIESYFTYRENIGTSTTPSFSLATINPFGLATPSPQKLYSPVLKDFDNDDDLDLIFLQPPNNFYYFENKICDTLVNNLVSLDDSISLTAIQSNAQYQWIQCGNYSFAEIEGEVNQTFFPVQSGSYKVAITTEECFAFSECYEFHTTEDSMPQNFLPPVLNPFSLALTSDALFNIKSADYADLDYDGDIDAIIYSSSLDALYFIENEGTMEAPNFINPILIPVSLTTTEFLDNICLGDLDSDGDFDLMAGAVNGNIMYFENIGNETLAEYALPYYMTNSIPSYYEYAECLGLNSLELVDLDGDGDLDIYVAVNHTYLSWESFQSYYKKNNGSPNAPSFLGSSYSWNEMSGIGDFADLDFDGNSDYITMSIDESDENLIGNNILYKKNTGTFFEPVFTSYINPYNLGPVFPENLFSPSLTDFDNDNDLDLMFLQIPNKFYYFENKICNPSINNSVTVESSVSLTAIETSAQYEWYNCDNNTLFLVDGAIEQTFYPTESGNYFVKISTEDCAVNSICYEFVSCQDLIDTLVNIVDGSHLSSNYQNSASYKWLDCNNEYLPIEAENNSSFYPQESGSYSLEITNGNCKDTTFCFEFNICALFSSEIVIDESNIIAIQDDATYQWLDCNNDSLPIEEATNQIFSPSFAGNFALNVSNENCNFTSDCIEFIPCENISEEIIIDGYTAAASQDSAYYEWIDCDNGNIVSSGESNQSFTPEVSGNYSVIIYLGNCSYESDCYSLDLCNNIITTGVNFYNNSLTALEASADSYQWINCNSNYDPYIDGETNQSFTPNFSGSFAVEITKDNCTYLSECIDVIISGINDYSTSNQFSIVPNPTEGKLNVISDKPLQNAFVQIKSVTGQIIFEQKNISGANLVFDLSNHANGLYFLEVTENGVTTRLKIIKE